MVRAIPLLMIVCVFAGLPAIAQEGPPPYLFVIESGMKAADVPIWTMAMRDVATAHAESDNGNAWAAYQSTTGGPDTRFRFYIPLRKLAELDNWASTREVVIGALGADAGKAALRVLDAADYAADRLAAYNAPLSRPPAPRVAPYRHIWVLTVQIRKGKLIEYAALMRRVKRANDAHDDGAHWAAYADAIGGEVDTVELYFPFDRFAELDAWPGTPEILASHYGADEAARILEALDGISEATSQIWSLVPSLSVMPH